MEVLETSQCRAFSWRLHHPPSVPRQSMDGAWRYSLVLARPTLRKSHTICALVPTTYIVSNFSILS